MAQIILIDDDLLFASLVRKRLEADGHCVKYNEGAFGALTAVRHGTYDLILVDVQMPEIEGYRIVKLLQGNVGNAKIFLLSGIPEQELKLKAEDFCANGYICKGWGLDVIAKYINTKTQ